MSNNRFLLGVGPSGPQVIEGWHGLPYGKPLTRTKEYIEIVRKVFAREAPLQHRGEHYQIPYAGADASGLGKPLKSILHPNPDLQIYTAAISPAGLRTAGEVADGVQPFLMSPERTDIVTGPVLEGRLAAGRGQTLAGFDIAPFVGVAMGKDLQACRDAIKPQMALYIGGMGARGKNFYNDYFKRMGYEAAAAKIQDAYLDGRRDEAIAAVPDSFIDETALVGPPERIKDRLRAWKESSKGGKIGTMLLGGASIDALRVVAEAVL
jgi:F420-dependent oxidoreductase-like protein